jgi:hypothetical protein
MLSASKHADVLSKEDYDIDMSQTTKYTPTHTAPCTHSTLSPPPTKVVSKTAREPTAYNLFVSSLPPKIPNRFVYAAQAWKEISPAEKERMRAFLVQHTHELRDIHPDIRQRFRAITQLWLLAKN